MSYPINSQIKPYQNQQQGVVYTGLPADALGNVGSNVKDNVKDNALLQKAKTSVTDKPWFLAAMMAPLWVGFMKAMSVFNKACADRADGGKNLMEQIRDFGDRVAGKASETRVSRTVTSNLREFSKFVNVHVIDKSQILSAMFRTPSKPTNKMVLTIAGGTLTELASDASTAFEEYEKTGRSWKALGFSDEVINGIKQKPHEHIEDIIKAARKASGESVTIKNAMGLPIPGPLQRTIHFSELANKMEALKGLKNPAGKTILGKLLPKYTIRALEGMTNGTAGGKIMILMQAYIYANAIKVTANAPKGEKVKTFMENVIYDLGAYLTIPLGLAAMHSVGGLQYIGMSKEKVEAYRKQLEVFNEKALKGGFASKAEYSQAKKVLKAQLKGDLKGIKKVAVAPLKWAARVITVGLESYRGYMSPDLATKAGSGAKFSRFFKKFGYGFKNVAGYPMRFGLFAMLIAPFFGKLTARGSHAIFGRPTKSVLDTEEPKEQKAQQGPMIQPQQITQVVAKPISKTPQPLLPKSQPAQPAFSGAEYKQDMKTPEGVVLSQSADAPSTQMNSVAPDSASALNANAVMEKTSSQKSVQNKPVQPKEPVRSYIPSSEGVKIQPGSVKSGQPDDKINAMFNKAQIAEKMALDILGAG